MPEKSDYLEQVNKGIMYRHNLWRIVAVLSIVVVLAVFWNLKLTGIGIAGEAFCGQEEHCHDEQCMNAGEPCLLKEHIHVESCYSDITADLETVDDWEDSLGDMVLGPTVKENVVLVAQSQLGYTESTLNFQMNDQGVRQGITRYGQWYGNPYGDWSAMFVAFCLEYAGVEDAPSNGGPETMRLKWEEAELYRPAGEGNPTRGEVVFVGKGGSESANAVAIITEVTDTYINVIEGDVERSVARGYYLLEDPAILGYGMIPDEDPVKVVGTVTEAQPGEATPDEPGEATPDEPEGSGSGSLSGTVIAPEIDQADAPVGTRCTVWLDGTDGGMTYLTGSPNTAYTALSGDIIQLPETWTSPSKYSYKLRGWYDITNKRYYKAGAQMEVTDNAVLYADWVASTYDIGVFNAQVAQTASTNAFITTHLFDYNYLFNIQSATAQSTINSNNHSETWTMVSAGNAGTGSNTLDFIFSDNDAGGQLNMPNNRSDHNMYHEATTVSSGIYTTALGQILFDTDNGFNPDTGEGVLGKTYLGTGDYLFQLMDDPQDQHYGYYYYDSKHNAASYHQSNQRFYVYDYLSATSDSIGGAYSDFLPINSPYVNTNGKTVGRFTYDGVDGEYQGVSHYRYDSKYDSGDYNSTNNVQADYAYGMRIDINFYLPNDPGTGGNKDIYGNDMQFQFSGDDDLWVLMDETVILDIGGIHEIVGGSVDFSTGQVLVNGEAQSTLMDLGITAGDHTLTVLYLERGSSMSNCAIYFNLAPRYGLELKKEDALTQQLLDGTKFTVYEDLECTQPVELWVSEDVYNQDILDGGLDRTQSTFTVKNGVAKLWGLGSGNIYYIKETGPPNAEGYGLALGVIRLTIEKDGYASYHVDVIPDAEGNEPSNGFTVHGVRIDEQTQTVYLTATNAPETVLETTTVQVIKKWEDTRDHSQDYIQAYLTVTDPDGTVRRIREVTLSDENDWSYLWTNLPKYDYETLTEVQYGIEESYESGYYSTVRKITHIEITNTTWAEALSFQNGETYILRTANGYLSTLDDRADTGYIWVDEQTAKNSPNALWTTSVNNNTVTFTNGKNQTITFYYNGGSPTDFFASIGLPNQQSRQDFSYSSRSGGLQIFYRNGNTSYYLTSSMNSSGKFGYSTNANSSLIFNPIKRVTQTDIRDFEDWAYEITNTPLASDNETALNVEKVWEIPAGSDETLYQEFHVTVRLLANGINTGRTVTLNLKNDWRGSFRGLPYRDSDGNVIEYSVQEVWTKDRWTVSYGQIYASGAAVPTYSTTLTNTYYQGGPELPATGSNARILYVLCGLGIMLMTLVYGIGSRRKWERRTE